MQHKKVTPSQNHIAHAFEYSNATTRQAATGLTSDDIGKLALQLDDYTFWCLSSVSPLIWIALAAGGGIPNSEKGQPLGVATLNASGRVEAAQSSREHPDGWNDIVGSIEVRSGGGSNAPTYAKFNGNIYAYSFSASALNQFFTSFHITHDYKPNTPIYLHMHFAKPTAGNGNVRWGFEVTIARGYNRGDFGTTNTYYVEQAVSATPYSHSIAELAVPISSTELETDALVLVRAFRDATHPNDTETGAVFGLMCDVHYESSQSNTPNKNYPFY